MLGNRNIMRTQVKEQREKNKDKQSRKVSGNCMRQ